MKTAEEIKQVISGLLLSEEPVFTRPSGYCNRTITDRCIVCVGVGPGYGPGFRSTLNHCTVYDPDSWQLFYDQLPDGCPPHSEKQYAFKIHALDRAIQAGFKLVLWMDTSFQPVASLEPLWSAIARDGWLIPKQGDSKLGNWCADYALDAAALTRDQAMDIRLVFSGLVGLDMTSDVGRSIWYRWKGAYESGVFNGPHENIVDENFSLDSRDWKPWGRKWRGYCSDDPRCQGHRHDESALSWILHDLGLIPESTGMIEGIESHDGSGCIGHHVPDYDVVAMRKWILTAAEDLSYDSSKEVKRLTR